ncbi:MAG: hypothetical protein ACI4QI_02110 [Candidatus Coproplasma sp.]
MDRPKKQQVVKLITHINTDFYDRNYSRQILIDNSIVRIKPKEGEDNQTAVENAINIICENIINKGVFQLDTSVLTDENRYFHIAFSDYNKFRRDEKGKRNSGKEKLIYRVERFNKNKYCISTGLYCGVINLDNGLPQLQIETGYSVGFFTRMLNFCCGIYADHNTTEQSTKTEGIYSLMVQYLFLISLRKVASKAIPQKYVILKDRGYSINGNIDIEAYVNRDIIASDKMVTYTYPKRLEIQPIIDVIYWALKCCKINTHDKLLPSLTSFKNYINELYSGVRPSKNVINNIEKEKVLNNSLYADFKRPLEYAKILLANMELNSGTTKSTSGVSGFLVDSSFIWEMYLYNLLKMNLSDWEIDAQCEISFYGNTFYPKKNYPDLVLRHRNTGAVFIFDAKFKKMEFRGEDVDNDDIRQLHAYSYNYHLKEGDNFKGCALLYPTKIDRPDNLNKHTDNIFGLDTTDKKFGVFALKDPSSGETIFENEAKFIEEIKGFISD